MRAHSGGAGIKKTKQRMSFSLNLWMLEKAAAFSVIFILLVSD